MSKMKLLFILVSLFFGAALLNFRYSKILASSDCRPRTDNHIAESVAPSERKFHAGLEGSIIHQFPQQLDSRYWYWALHRF